MGQDWGCDVLVFGAHPDDAEIGVGGIVAQQARLGREVVFCDLTKGEMSSNGTPELRRKEALAAVEVLGVRERICLGLPDRGLNGGEAQVAEIVRVIREYRPRTVFCPWQGDLHPDHRETARLVHDGSLNARLRRYGVGRQWAVEKSWEYFIHEIPSNPIYIRLSEEDGQRKQEALACYTSQFESGAGAVATRLHQLPQRLEWRDRYAGSLVGSPWAEGIWPIGSIGVEDIWSLV